jgi:hypothetical protein
MEKQINRKDRKDRTYLESSICSKTVFFRKENTLIIAYSFFSKSLRTVIETGKKKKMPNDVYEVFTKNPNTETVCEDIEVNSIN